MRRIFASAKRVLAEVVGTALVLALGLEPVLLEGFRDQGKGQGVCRLVELNRGSVTADAVGKRSPLDLGVFIDATISGDYRTLGTLSQDCHSLAQACCALLRAT